MNRSLVRFGSRSQSFRIYYILYYIRVLSHFVNSVLCILNSHKYSKIINVEIVWLVGIRMKKHDPNIISIVIPAYNEQDSLERLTDEIWSVAQTLPQRVEIIFVDDGSDDATVAKIEQLCAAHSEIKFIGFRRNFGKAAALDAGFAVASGDIVFTMDADLQDDPAEIPNFIAALDQGYDVVSGWKHVRHDPLDKTLPSKLFNRVVSTLSGVKLNDFNCGFKAYRAEALTGLSLYGELHRFIPVLLHWKGFKIGEVAVNHRSRQFGKSKYGMGRLFKGALDFLGVMLNTRYATRPLHVFGGVGFLFGGAGVLILSYLTALWFAGAGPIGDRPLLLLGILMIMSSFQFVTIGLLGEFIQRQGADRTKQYTVAKTQNLEQSTQTDRAISELRFTANFMRSVQDLWKQQQSELTQAPDTSTNTPTKTQSTG